jgi:hypothetical protein
MPDLVDDDEVPYQRIICDMLNNVWQQPNPHEWQMKGIHKPFDAGTLMALHVPPDSGKTTVMRGVVTLLHGISIIIMPTLALAGNQVSKTLSFKINKADKNILHVIHLDDIKEKKTKQHLKRECKKLQLMPKHKRPAILLYMLAQCTIHDNWCVWLRRVVDFHQTCRFIAVGCRHHHHQVEGPHLARHWPSQY